MSSSMRNAVQRRNHKERAQPIERQKWGLLEKRKDYSLRAKDHKEKQKRLKILREKAANRNPDEFNFGMLSSRTVDGIRVGDRGNEALSQSVVQLLKTQDAGYLRTMLQRTRKERERLEKSLHLDDEADADDIDEDEDQDDDDDDDDDDDTREKPERQRKHIVFVDSVENQDNFEAEEWFGTDGKGLKRTWSRPRRQNVDDGISNQKPSHGAPRRSRREIEAEQQTKMLEKAERVQRLKAKKHQEDLLAAVKKREQELFLAEQQLDLQRAKMSNSIGGVNKNGVRFKIRERKR